MKILPVVISDNVSGVISFAKAWFDKTARMVLPAKRSVVYQYNGEDFLVMAEVPKINPQSGKATVIQVSKSLPSTYIDGGFAASGVSDVAAAMAYNKQTAGGFAASGVSDVATAATYTNKADGGFAASGSSNVSASQYLLFTTTGGFSSSGSSSVRKMYLGNEIVSEGGIIAGGYADIGILTSYYSDGGVVVSGSAEIGKLASYISEGGVVVAGAAVFNTGYDFATSGGIVVGGSADSNTLSSYTSLGGIVAGGAADLLKMSSYASAGGIVVGGSARIGDAYISSGGIVAGGEAAVNLLVNYASIGGVVAGGAAAFTQGASYYSVGGVVAGGTAVTSTAAVYSSTGGIVAGGVADIFKAAQFASTGGVVAGGFATFSHGAAYASTGGIVTGGAASLSSTTSFASTGGAVVGGAAATNRLAKYTSSGGAVVGGAAVLGKMPATIGLDPNIYGANPTESFFYYTGSSFDQASEVVTDPAGLNFTLTCDGSTTLPYSIGTFTIVATIDDPLYEGTGSWTLFVDKGIASPIVTLDKTDLVADEETFVHTTCDINMLLSQEYTVQDDQINNPGVTLLSVLRVLDHTTGRVKAMAAGTAKISRFSLDNDYFYGSQSDIDASNTATVTGKGQLVLPPMTMSWTGGITVPVVNSTGTYSFDSLNEYCWVTDTRPVFTSSNTAVCQVTSQSDGVANITIVGTGQFYIAVTWAGDSRFNAATSVNSETVNITKSYSFTSAGGAVAGGAAVVAFKRTYSHTSTGGAVVGGAATVVSAAAQNQATVTCGVGFTVSVAYGGYITVTANGGSGSGAYVIACSDPTVFQWSSYVGAGTSQVQFLAVGKGGTSAYFTAYREGSTYNGITYKTSAVSSASTVVGVIKAYQTDDIVLSIPDTSLVVGDTVQATATGGDGTGAYQFWSNNVRAVSCTPEGLITALSVTTSLDPCDIRVMKLGDDYYNQIISTSLVNITVAKANQSVPYVTIDDSTIDFGTYTYLHGNGGNGTGLYEFKNSDNNSGTGVTWIGAGGQIMGINIGTTNVYTRRLGDANYQDSAWSAPLTIAVVKATQGLVSLVIDDQSLVVSASGLGGTNAWIQGGLGMGNLEFRQSSSSTSYVPSTLVNMASPVSGIFVDSSTYISAKSTTDVGTVYISGRKLGDDYYLDSDWTAWMRVTVEFQKIIQSITLTSSSNIPRTIYVGDTFQVYATSTSGSAVTFTSGNTAIATITSNYLVTAVSAGSVTLYMYAAATSQYNSASSTIGISVLKAPQTLSVSLADNTLTEGYKTQINIDQTPWTGGGALSFTSSDNNVATVYYEGGYYYVATHYAGTATITATAAETHAYLSASASVTVYVSGGTLTLKYQLFDYMPSSWYITYGYIPVPAEAIWVDKYNVCYNNYALPVAISYDRTCRAVIFPAGDATTLTGINDCCKISLPLRLFSETCVYPAMEWSTGIKFVWNGGQLPASTLTQWGSAPSMGNLRTVATFSTNMDWVPDSLHVQIMLLYTT